MKKRSPRPAFDGSLPAPRFISIETTRYCNLSCPMCLQYLEGSTVTGPHMDEESFRRIATQVFPHIEEFQASVSGEPLMSKSLDLQLSLAEHYGVRTELCSNGTFLDARMRRRILPSLGRLILSIDGATKETFEWIRHGASFETVIENVRALGQEVAKIPARHRPVLSFGVTLMRQNIAELPELVSLASELGMHYVAASHVHPVTDEMKAQSLVHDIEGARKHIDSAIERARKLEMPLSINGLDKIIAATAMQHASHRELADTAGVVPGLEPVRVLEELIPPFPSFDESSAEANSVKERRLAAQELSQFPKRATADPVRSPRESSIQVCDYAWNKAYVSLDGQVKPCCVPGSPNLGSLDDATLPEIWNGEAYRRIREALVRRDPIGLCRGCQHIREVTTEEEIDAWIGDTSIPREAPTAALPVELDPFRKRSRGETAGLGARKALLRVDCPTIDWEAAEEGAGYCVQFSLDPSFEGLVHETSRLPGRCIRESSWRVPLEKWREAPFGKTIHWRCFVLKDGERKLELGALQASGTLLREWGSPE